MFRGVIRNLEIKYGRAYSSDGWLDSLKTPKIAISSPNFFLSHKRLQIDIAILSICLSVCPSVCLSVRGVPVLDENGSS